MLKPPWSSLKTSHEERWKGSPESDAGAPHVDSIQL